MTEREEIAAKRGRPTTSTPIPGPDRLPYGITPEQVAADRALYERCMRELDR